MTLYVSDDAMWLEVQQRMRMGETLTPLLLLGDDAGYVWIPKNGSTTLKRAWLEMHHSDPPKAHLDIHSAVLAHTRWFTSDQVRVIADRRSLMAIWRDPIDRFVSACRSHLIELTTSRLHSKWFEAVSGDPVAFEACAAFHQHLFSVHGVKEFTDNSDPVHVMNATALQLQGWINCHIDWCHHTLPQVSFLGGDPSIYTSILGIEDIGTVVQHWSAAAGRELDQTPQNVSATSSTSDPWRRLRRQDLNPEAIQALENFYEVDWAFIRLAQFVLGEGRIG